MIQKDTMNDYKMVKNRPAVHEKFVARNCCDRMYYLLEKLEGRYGQQT